MSKLQGVKDRRRHQRVVIDTSEKIDTVIIGYGPALVFDMSYSGAAISQPAEKPVEPGQTQIELHIKTRVDEARIAASIIRIGEEVLALEFEDISVDARIIIDRVVTDRIVGMNMNLVDPKYYSEKVDFSYWFHGPRDTNLYLWTNQDQLVSAELEGDRCALSFSEDGFFFENKRLKGASMLNNVQMTSKALAIVEQMEHEVPALHQFREALKSHAE